MAKERARLALQALDIECTATNVEHMEVLLEAHAIFRMRNEVYGDMWQEGGHEDSRHHAKSKVMRMFAATKREVLLDSAIDLINYAAFFYRNLRAGR